ncbi:MAG: lipoyl(octanoyl) transferase LipB [Halofilum sp. (in: g-proteobacteria)]|nr:lipoyl(octanoyl) transferase LipB [Halofilum sp. (in: g-proteobacteria)]
MAAAAALVSSPAPVVRDLGRVPYEPTWQAMQAFTDARTPETPDEFWRLEHPPVFTLGRAARPEHVLAPGEIPVVQVDRGGQVTYHGPGQLVVYTLVDLRRLGMGVRRLVQTLEAALIDTLGAHGVSAATRPGAPGVYVGEAKIAALGLRVRRGCSFHGLALNVDCELEPFERIDPCGYRGLRVTRTRDQGIDADLHRLGDELLDTLCMRLGYAGSAGTEPAVETA